jgi:hypothetical protein
MPAAHALRSLDPPQSRRALLEITAQRQNGAILQRHAIIPLPAPASSLRLAAETDSAALDRILAGDFLHPVPFGLALTKRQHID